MTAPVFPITPLLPAIADSLASHPRLVLEAPPGAGKTTQVPLALLAAPWLDGQKILMLEPRRVAARSAAQFMARQLGENVGDTVGYRIRFESRVSAATRIEVVTEGILTRLIQDDPLLEGVGAILFDEFHERHLAADLGLALALDVQAGLREDLRLVVMSATLDGEKLSRFLDAPRLSSEGRSHPVEVSHFPARRDEALEAQARRAVVAAIEQHPGDVLVFLPGQREIARVDAALHGQLPDSVDVLALHGELPVEAQQRVLAPAADGRRRVVLATNVAESSVTLPGVRVVIDSGLAREPRFDPNSGFSRLDVVTIAQASADQRAGRAGRVSSGWAWRLWPQSQRLEPQRRAEIVQTELAGLALELAAWGSEDLRFVDAPPAGTLAAARDLLQRLGALHGSTGLTAFGRRLLAMGTHPRLAAMLSAAQGPRQQALAADIAALIEARDPLRGGGDGLASRWRALAAFRAGHIPGNANRGGLAAIDAATRQWRRRLRCEATPPADIQAHELGDLLSFAFPDRIACVHPSDVQRYQLANGRSARLLDASELRGQPWLVISELRAESRDGLILRAAPVDEAFLRQHFAGQFVTADVVRWNAEKRALEARRESRFARIVIDSRPAGKVDPALAAQALTAAVADLGIVALPWTDSLRQWQARVQGLRAWMPELDLPDVSDAALLESLHDWLHPAFAGKTRIDALSEAELGEALKSGIDWNTRQLIDRHAPTRIAVPSGLERAITYAIDDDGSSPRPPVLAVKLQELFGLADTPRIADGRVALLLHLLSPGGKPLQVTADLRNFWENTYAEVKKEMKGRYPRHPWPDDPWSTTATHRAKPRGT